LPQQETCDGCTDSDGTGRGADGDAGPCHGNGLQCGEAEGGAAPSTTDTHGGY
jgi:hypothetical protein